MSKTAPQEDVLEIWEEPAPLPPVIALTELQRAKLELIAAQEGQLMAETKIAIFNFNIRRQLIMREIEQGAGIPEGALSKYHDVGKELVLAVKE